MGAKHCDQHICLSVCLSAHISKNPSVQIFTKFSIHLRWSLLMTVQWVMYLWFFWLKSCFHIMEPMDQSQWCVCFIAFARWRQQSGGTVAVYDCRLVGCLQCGSYQKPVILHPSDHLPISDQLLVAMWVFPCLRYTVHVDSLFDGTNQR